MGPGPGQSWFISVLGSQFPSSLEISSRFPSSAWFPWKDLHVAAGSREEWDFALRGSKLILGVKLEQILGQSQGCQDLSAWGIPEQLHMPSRLPCREVPAGPGWSLSAKGEELRLHKVGVGHW